MSDATAPSNIVPGVHSLPESHTDFVLSVIVSDPLFLAAILLLGAAAIVLVLLLRRRSGSSKGR